MLEQPSLSPKQRLALHYLSDNKTTEVTFGGAAGGGKSWLGSFWLLWAHASMPRTRSFVCRANMKDSRQSVYTTFEKVAHAYNFKQYKTNNEGIIFNNGSEIVLLDGTFYPFKDPNFDRFGSKEFTFGMIEEAQQLPEKARAVLDVRTNRHLNKEYGVLGKVLQLCNPGKNYLYKDVYKPWKAGTLPAHKVFIPCLATDNDNLPEEYIQRLEQITDPVLRARLLDGLWEEEDNEEQLMPNIKIESVFTNSFVADLIGQRYMTADIAMQGSDKLVVCVWNNWTITNIYTLSKNDGKQAVEFLRGIARKHSVPYSNICFDGDGVGAAISGHLKGAYEFRNGAAAIRGNYANLKTQCYYLMADRVNNDGLYIAAVLPNEAKDEIYQEMEMIWRDVPDAGKLRCKDKKFIKARIGRSPDYWDAIAMRYAFELRSNLRMG